MQKIVLIGCNGNSWDCVEIIRAINEKKKIYDIVGYVDDDSAKRGKIVYDLSVLGDLNQCRSMKNCFFAFCIGSVKSIVSKMKIIESLGIKDNHFPTLIHPSSIISKYAEIGAGVIIGPWCKIEAGTRIGKFTYVHSHCIISHESEVGEYSILAANVNIAGRVKIGKSCYFGSSSAVRNDILIGDSSVIGIGAVLIKNVRAGVKVAGVPALEI